MIGGGRSDSSNHMSPAMSWTPPSPPAGPALPSALTANASPRKSANPLEASGYTLSQKIDQLSGIPEIEKNSGLRNNLCMYFLCSYTIILSIL